MTTEEKAEAYDKVFARAKRMFSEKELNYLFSELIENEDDKLREQVVYAINQLHVCECTKTKLLTWLQKQGEQKPIEEYNITGIGSKNAQGKLGEMTKKLKPVNEVLEQNPAWSEEDEAHFDSISKRCTPGITYTSTRFSINEDINWLKSIKDRIGNFDHGYKVGFSAAKHNQWKPSDKQMNALDSTLQYSQVSHNSLERLNSLFNDLKKLREE